MLRSESVSTRPCARTTPPSAELVLKAFADEARNDPLGRYVEQGIAASLRAAVSEQHEPEVPPWYKGDECWAYQAGMNAMRDCVIATAAAIESASDES